MFKILLLLLLPLGVAADEFKSTLKLGDSLYVELESNAMVSYFILNEDGITVEGGAMKSSFPIRIKNPGRYSLWICGEKEAVNHSFIIKNYARLRDKENSK